MVMSKVSMALEKNNGGDGASFFRFLIADE
jgi:hypothetical protein